MKAARPKDVLPIFIVALERSAISTLDNVSRRMSPIVRSARGIPPRARVVLVLLAPENVSRFRTKTDKKKGRFAGCLAARAPRVHVHKDIPVRSSTYRMEGAVLAQLCCAPETVPPQWSDWILRL